MRGIVVKSHFEAIHFYPDAPEQVSFLRNRHRHRFDVSICLETAGDRELEFFMVKKDLDNVLRNLGNDIGDSSCESLCEQIEDGMVNLGYDNIMMILVWEDGENGSWQIKE